MKSKKPYIRKIPFYTQHPNGCGLSAVLMLLDLPNNKKIERFLTKIWNKVKILFLKATFNEPELQLSVALQYILLKSIAYSDDKEKEKIFTFFKTRFDYTYEDIRIMNKHTQDQNYKILLNDNKNEKAYTYLQYLENHDYITPIILNKNLNTMKTDMELKILGEIFNFKYEYQRSDDLTGAIYFSEDELRRKQFSLRTKIKWKKLEKWADDPNYIILYGQYHHWLAVCGVYRKFQFSNKEIKEMEIKQKGKFKKRIDEIKAIFDDDPIEDREWNPKEMIIDVNDPAIKKKLLLKFTELSEGDRFYIFKKRPDTDFSIFSEFIKNTKADIPNELKIYQDYLKRLHGQKEKPKKKVNEIKVELGVEVELEDKKFNDQIQNTKDSGKIINPAQFDEENKINKDKKKSEINSTIDETPKFWNMLDDS